MYADAPERMVQLRFERITDTDREKLKMQLRALEAKIQEHMDLTKKQEDEAQRRRQELQEEPDDEEDGGAQRTLAIQEIEKQSRLLEADQTSSAVIFLQVRPKRIGQDIANIITSDDSNALVGMPESVVGKFNQRIKHVTTQRNSAVVVGVFDKNVDMRNYFKPS
jgi:DNA gyrase/topoisomerase IV subunit A